jgi:hypothetical protein
MAKGAAMRERLREGEGDRRKIKWNESLLGWLL